MNAASRTESAALPLALARQVEAAYQRFEAAWRHWLTLHAGFSTSGRRAKLQALIDALVGVKNVYPARSLFDCTGDEAKPPFILGRTSLGRGPTGSA